MRDQWEGALVIVVFYAMGWIGCLVYQLWCRLRADAKRKLRRCGACTAYSPGHCNEFDEMCAAEQDASECKHYEKRQGAADG